jgi:hypothetical protein
MRTVLLLCVLTLAGCAEPPAPVVEEPITVAVQEPPLHQRMTPQELEWYINNESPIHRALARREIDVGSRIEPLLARFPNFEVTRHDPYITLVEPREVPSTLELIAKNGKLISAIEKGCHHFDVFFDERSRGECNLWTDSYYAALTAQRERIAPPPRAKP